MSKLLATTDRSVGSTNVSPLRVIRGSGGVRSTSDCFPPVSAIRRTILSAPSARSSSARALHARVRSVK
jgi:hypothetical protein